MNKENAIAKINKYGKIGKIITVILLVLAIIGTVTTIVSGIFLIAIPKDLIEFNIANTATLSVDTKSITPAITDADKEKIIKAFDSDLEAGFNLGAVKFTLDEVEFTEDKMVASSTGNATDIPLGKLGFAILTAAGALVLTVISLIFGMRLCKAFEECESPFEENVIKKMRYFAIALLPWAIYSSVPESVINSAINNSLKISTTLDTNVIFTVLVIFALSTVFKYGAELQRESDETL